MKAYHDLVNEVVTYGAPRVSRVGPTRQMFGKMLEWHMSQGFPLITTRRMYPKPIFGELAAFLNGADHVSEFRAYGCNYWDADAKRWGRDGALGRIYGVQWRDWGGRIDQLRNLVNGLIDDPHGRRHIVTAWNPGELHVMALPPCHTWFQCNVDDVGNLDMLVYMRSVDLCLGLPADLCLYGLLLSLLAREVGLEPGRLVFTFGDCHVYENHVAVWETEQQPRSPLACPIPFIRLSGRGLFEFHPNDVALFDYEPFSPVNYILNTVEVPRVF